MNGLAITFGAVFLVSFLGAPLLGAGWFWDAGNGLGFTAFAGLLFLSLSSGPGSNLRAHQVLGYAVLGVTAVHAFWFLVGDPVAIEYIKPGAPAYMWLGIAGFVLLGILITIGLPRYRNRLHRNYSGFRYWHRVLAIAAIAGAAAHLSLSNFYLGTWYQAALLTAIAIAACFGHRSRFGSLLVTRSVTRLYLGLGALATIGFAALRNLPQ